MDSRENASEPLNAGPRSAIALPDWGRAESFGSEFQFGGTVVFVVNTDFFFLTHRSSWAASLRASGAKVVVIARDTGYGDQISAIGIDFINLDIGREGIKPIDVGRATLRLTRILSSIKPRIVFLVATAAYTVGTLAVYLLPKTKFIVVVTGVGRALSGERISPAAKVVTFSLRALANRTNATMVFQLPADREAFVRSRMSDKKRSTVIEGTGVDVERWAPENMLHDEVTVLYAARLFREKGIYDFVDIARQLARPGVRFVAAGGIDEGVATAVTSTQLRAWGEEGIVEFMGYQTDMRSVFRNADVLVAPSTHPEGTPRALIEASACGLAIVAYRQPGVELVLNSGRAGLLVEPRDVIGLRDAVEKLLVSPSERHAYAASAREHAVRTFSLESVLSELYATCGLEKYMKQVVAVIPSIGAVDVPALRGTCHALSSAGAKVSIVSNARSLTKRLAESDLPFVTAQTNSGFGLSIGQVADADIWDWLLIVNDDVEIGLDAAREIMQEISHHETNSTEIVYVGEISWRRIPKLIDIFLNFSLLGRLAKVSDRLAERAHRRETYGSFDCVLISRQLWDKIGGFDRRIIFTYEDADFVRRASRISEFVSSALPVHGVKKQHSVSSASHVTNVLPVSVCSARAYAQIWGYRSALVTLVLVFALTLRIITGAFGRAGPVRNTFGVILSIGSLVGVKAPALPDYFEL